MCKRSKSTLNEMHPNSRNHTEDRASSWAAETLPRDLRQNHKAGVGAPAAYCSYEPHSTILLGYQQSVSAGTLHLSFISFNREREDKTKNQSLSSDLSKVCM